MAKRVKKLKKPRLSFDGQWPEFEPFSSRFWTAVFKKIRLLESVNVPISVISRINRTGDWVKMWKRTGEQKSQVMRALQSQIGMKMTEDMSRALHGADGINGIIVSLTRHGAEHIDSDNLESGFKGIRDSIAEWLGVDDADCRISWVCRQYQSGEGCAKPSPCITIDFYEEPVIFENKSHVAIVYDEKEYSASEFKILGEAGFGLTKVQRMAMIRRVAKSRARSKQIEADKKLAHKELVVVASSEPLVSWDGGGEWERDAEQERVRSLTGTALWEHILSNARKR